MTNLSMAPWKFVPFAGVDPPYSRLYVLFEKQKDFDLLTFSQGTWAKRFDPNTKEWHKQNDVGGLGADFSKLTEVFMQQMQTVDTLLFCFINGAVRETQALQ